MNKSISAYLDTACSQIKSKQTRLSTRAELSGHIHTLTDELKQNGLCEEDAVRAALERMGDPYDIGKQIASYNAPWQNNLTAAAGIVLLAAVFIWLAVFRDIYLFDFSALLYVALFTLAFVLIGGLSRLTRLSALIRGRGAALYAGGTGVIIGAAEMLGNMRDMTHFGAGLSFCVTSLLYGLVISAILTSAANLRRPLEGNEIRKILGWEDL
ncbi:MAG: permease prefix domain 1-containing protein [Oscillospiraceae bacterium]|jgi:hypothetical protein|nr:permease prefix domain 1-containing protein [Oscillospiraceae bacterium]